MVVKLKDLSEALEDYLQTAAEGKKASIRAIAQKYVVSRNTLARRVEKATRLRFPASELKLYQKKLTDGQEAELANWVENQANSGVSPFPRRVRNMANLILKQAAP